MATKFVLEIEKYLDHQVNDLCEPYGVDGKGDLREFYGPNKFNEAIGIPLIMIHHKQDPGGKWPNFTKEYFMLDFEDFLEYATSNLAPAPAIDIVPHYSCYYYQALPGTFDKPLVTNKHGRFSVIGVCLSRFEDSIWINVQFRVEPESSSKKECQIIDLVGGMNGFLHEFVTLRLMDDRKESFSSEKMWSLWNTGKSPHETRSGASLAGLFELTKSWLKPPFASDCQEFQRDEYALMCSGAMWDGFADMYQQMELPEDDPSDGIESPISYKDWREWLLGQKERVRISENHFNTVMADQFEITRLMLFLPSYFDFMYDLVVKEKKEGSSLLCVGNGKIKLSGNEVDDSDQISG